MARLSAKTEIIDFVQEQGYTAQDQDPLLVLKDEDGLTIFAVIDDTQIEFMVDLCGVNALDGSKLEEIYERISRPKHGDFAVLFRDRFGRSERQTGCPGSTVSQPRIFTTMNSCLRSIRLLSTSSPLTICYRRILTNPSCCLCSANCQMAFMMRKLTVCATKSPQLR